MQESISPSEYQYQQDAEPYCSSLSLGGVTWLVPSLVQLQGLLDTSAPSPMTNHEAFPGANGTFWSSTIDTGDPNQAWFLNFEDGSSRLGPVSCPGGFCSGCLDLYCQPRVRCVHP